MTLIDHVLKFGVSVQFHALVEPDDVGDIQFLVLETVYRLIDRVFKPFRREAIVDDPFGKYVEELCRLLRESRFQPGHGYDYIFRGGFRAGVNANCRPLARFYYSDRV